MTATAADRRSAVGRTGLVVLATVAALPFSFRTLVEDYRYGAPLGELVVVPVAALLLALVAAHRHSWVAQLRPGRADHAVAGAAFAVAAALLLLAPVALGNVYFAMRPDLLAVPLVMAAAACLVLGVRALVALVAPLLLALLAWPLPARALLESVAGAVADATGGALQLVLARLPLAEVVPASGDLRLSVAAPDGPFEVVVATACSGTTGIAGSLIVGLAAQYVLHGRRRARLAWLAAVGLTAWALNLVRILLLLAVGRDHGERAALELFHPVAGLVLLNLGFAALLLAAPRFGLTLSLRRSIPADSPLTRPAQDRPMDVVTLSRRVVVLAVAVGTLAVLNTTLPGTAAAVGPGGAPRPVLTEPAAVVPGFVAGPAEELRWARRYFGDDSSWVRRRLSPAATTTGFSVWADSITTGSWGALRAHPVVDCYRFHGFDVIRRERTVIASGLLAEEVVYRAGNGGTWHVLTWEWPVRLGDGLGHQRVTLLASSTRERLSQPEPGRRASGLRAALAGLGGGGSDPNPSLTLALRDVARSVLAVAP